MHHVIVISLLQIQYYGSSDGVVPSLHAKKTFFRDALKKRRCLILADSEWQKLGKVKQPVRIVLKSRELFGLAGLWDRWTSPEQEKVLSCTIITTGANELMQEVHDRMLACSIFTIRSVARGGAGKLSRIRSSKVRNAGNSGIVRSLRPLPMTLNDPVVKLTYPKLGGLYT